MEGTESHESMNNSFVSTLTSSCILPSSQFTSTSEVLDNVEKLEGSLVHLLSSEFYWYSSAEKHMHIKQ